MYASPTENVTRELLRSALYFLLPAPCLACGEAIRVPRRSLGLCASCRDRLERWPGSVCDCCGKPLGGARPTRDGLARGLPDGVPAQCFPKEVPIPHLPAGYRCGACRRHPPPYERLVSAWSYRSPLDAVLTGLKFRRLEYLGAQLGQAVGDLLRSELAGCDLVVPVPLHWRRYLRRGYNQAAVIARPVAAELGLPMASVLHRRRATPAQSRLSRVERRRNLRGAFSIRPGVAIGWPVSCAGRHVLLVDDVVTTGTTLETAAACLCRAGAASVTALTVARTPDASD